MIIKRELLKELADHLNNPEISLITGPRQAGKTTVIKILKKSFEARHEPVVYFNLDLESDWQFFSSQEKLLETLRLRLGHNRGFVFIDEIQRKENAGLFLKGIYDLETPYKFVVSGSGSLELKEKIHESLAGRKRIFELSTLSFTEFVNHKTNYLYEEKLGEFLASDKIKAESLLLEYLSFGGYPKVVLQEKIEEKLKTIDEVYQSYLVRDISYIYRIEKTEAFTHLFKLMASLIGQTINHNWLSKELGLNLVTVKKFLWYLEKTFILGRTTPYFRSLGKEIRKAPIYYFTDLGLRNYASGRFDRERIISDPTQTGFLFQNFVYRRLKEKMRLTTNDLHFWRTKDGAETDFVWERGTEILPIEVKYKNLKEPEVPRSLKSFIEKYHPPQAWLVNLNLESRIDFKGTEVKFVPYFRLFESSF